MLCTKMPKRIVSVIQSIFANALSCTISANIQVKVREVKKLRLN